MCTCNVCGSILRSKTTEPKPEPMIHYVNGVQHISMMVTYDDAFYKITDGKYKGNLVHRWNTKKF